MPTMTYVISSACVDVKHKACAQECPMDCIYEGDRTMYINPNECVDCGACKLLCEVDAIYYESDLPEEERKFAADNAAFFTDVLPGRDAPLGDPGGADALGPVGVDTPMVAAQPPKTS
jgi:NAD-dependent dihydropyrimidine dehydrogenase PreA subunit